MCHKFLVLPEKKWLKSVHIYGSYRKIKTGVPFFWNTRVDSCIKALFSPQGQHVRSLGGQKFRIQLAVAQPTIFVGTIPLDTITGQYSIALDTLL